MPLGRLGSPDKWRLSSASLARTPPHIRNRASTVDGAWRWGDCRQMRSETPRETASDQDLFDASSATEVCRRRRTGQVGAKFADDLDADSLDLVEFVMALEESSTSTPKSRARRVDTIGLPFGTREVEDLTTAGAPQSLASGSFRVASGATFGVVVVGAT